MIKVGVSLLAFPKKQYRNYKKPFLGGSEGAAGWDGNAQKYT